MKRREKDKHNKKNYEDWKKNNLENQKYALKLLFIKIQKHCFSNKLFYTRYSV